MGVLQLYGCVNVANAQSPVLLSTDDGVSCRRSAIVNILSVPGRRAVSADATDGISDSEPDRSSGADGDRVATPRAHGFKDRLGNAAKSGGFRASRSDHNTAPTPNTPVVFVGGRWRFDLPGRDLW